MREWVFLVEGQAEKALLEAILPKLIPVDDPRRIIPFEGKQDMEKQLVRRIRGYLNPNAIFFLLRDQDAHPDCKAVKARLVQLCRDALARYFVVRISCREMESFFLADLAAVVKGLNEPSLRNLAQKQASRNYRAPDRLASPSQELLRVTQGCYQKVSGTRAIAPHLDLENQRSDSFRHLVAGIRNALQQWPTLFN